MALSRFRVSAGLVTVLEYGYGQVSAALGGRTSGLQLTATPPNTFIFSGRAREPGMSGLGGVRVFETVSNRSVITDAFGNFQIAALASVRSFKFDKDGYENTEVIPEMTSGPIIFLEAAMQPVIRLVPGQPGIALFVAPHDVSYVFEADLCYPCKLVRVTTPSAGRLRLTILQGSTSLRVWINGKRLTPDGTPLTVEAQVPAGEVPVYIGLNLPLSSGGTSNYVNFNLSASMVQ